MYVYPGKNIRMLCRDGIWIAKAQLEPNLARDVKNNKGFYRYVGQKGKIKENISSLVNKTEVVTTNMKKAENLNTYFCLSFQL